MTHSVVAPSADARRRQCPASTRLEALFPEEDGAEAREGTAAHWALAEALYGRPVPVGTMTPAGVPVDDEMLDAVDVAEQAIERIAAKHGLPVHMGAIEARVDIPRIHPQMTGTPDYNILGRAGIDIVDFKYGHRLIDAFECPQLICYAASWYGKVPETTPVTLTIIQPRAYHRDGPVRSWSTTLLDLRAQFNISQNAAAEALGDNPRARPGPECRDCRARHACEALQRASFAEMDVARRSMPLEMPPDAVAVELRLARRAIALLEARASGLEEQALAALKAGKHVPGWRVEHGWGRENWKVPAEQVIALGVALHLNLAKPPAAITPAQARDAGLDPKIVAGLAERKPAGAALVEDNGAKARRVFG